MIIKQDGITKMTCQITHVTAPDEWAVNAQVEGLSEDGKVICYEIIVSRNEIVRLFNAKVRASETRLTGMEGVISRLP